MTTNPKNKELIKQLEFVKQQEQLRALGSVSSTKVLSADSMIEDLLSKKETFQKRNPEIQKTQDLPAWLVSSPPPLYERVWAGVQTARGLADTQLLSTLLMSSGLPTDTLGYVWSLANRTVPGALTQSELYLVLALVAMAQNGYVVSNLGLVYQLAQAPVPSLDLAVLPTRVAAPTTYPSPLSVTSLPDSVAFSWNPQVPSETKYQSSPEKIDISYVSSGPMVSPKLLSEQNILPLIGNPQTSQLSNSSTTEFNINNSLNHKNAFVNLPSKSSFSSKTSSHSKHSSSNYSFSFPTLNESPSHIAKMRTDDQDSFDDDFTDFQSADFSSSSNKVQPQSTSMIDDDEFTNFQKASPTFGDDLSVLVVGGGNVSTAQKLWVADSLSIDTSEDKLSTLGFGTNDKAKSKETDLFTNDALIGSSSASSKINGEKIIPGNKYDALQELDDMKYSVFHNPLPDDEDRESVFSKVVAESDFTEPTSFFKHSLFEDLKPNSSDFSRPSLPTPSLELPKPFSDFAQKNKDDEDDEFYNFQNFPVSFNTNTAEGSSTVQNDTTNKYDVFRTIVFQEPSTQNSESSKPNEKANLNASQTLDCKMETLSKAYGVEETKSANNVDIEDNVVMKFGDVHAVQSAPSEFPVIDQLFSSLAISDNALKIDVSESASSSNLEPSEDRYKALRLLESSTGETDEFGEFLGADLPSSGNIASKDMEESSIQIRCLEACLSLLKDGLTTLSQATTSEVVTEVINDPRGNTYLDCLLEVRRVSERILSHMDIGSFSAMRAELEQVWESLATFYSDSEHNHLTETVGVECGICRSQTGPSPVTFGGLSFHTPCANLYLHCVQPVLPNLAAVQSH